MQSERVASLDKSSKLDLLRPSRLTVDREKRHLKRASSHLVDSCAFGTGPGRVRESSTTVGVSP